MRRSVLHVDLVLLFMLEVASTHPLARRPQQVRTRCGTQQSSAAWLTCCKDNAGLQPPPAWPCHRAAPHGTLAPLMRHSCTRYLQLPGRWWTLGWPAPGATSRAGRRCRSGPRPASAAAPPTPRVRGGRCSVLAHAGEGFRQLAKVSCMLRACTAWPCSHHARCRTHSNGASACNRPVAFVPHMPCLFRSAALPQSTATVTRTRAGVTTCGAGSTAWWSWWRVSEWAVLLAYTVCVSGGLQARCT